MTSSLPLLPVSGREVRKPRLYGIRPRDQSSSSLPIWRYKDQILKAVDSSQVILIVGETGSGKTTQVPQFLYYMEGFTRSLQHKAPGKIGITQPRRIAATTTAKRVCEEMRCGTIGGIVGYTVRFDDCTSTCTHIKFMTDGMLIRDAMLDPLLTSYHIIILDEAHQRSLRTDLLLGLLKNLLHRRSDLKLLVMSATLDYQRFLHFFDQNAKVIVVPGRQHPVQLLYLQSPEDDYIEASLLTVLQLHLEEPPGDVLVFLPGQEDIDALHTLLQEKRQILKRAGRKRAYHVMVGENAYKLPDVVQDLHICPIYAALPYAQQLWAFNKTPPTTRKVILATNIAETSLTLPGVHYVVDCGLSKQRIFQPKTGLEALQIQPIAKANADQRAGRAGREAPGKCYRLYTEDIFDKFRDQPVPELMRCDLSQVYLEMKVIGVRSPETFGYMDPPSPDLLQKAKHTLQRLGGLDDESHLTELGRSLGALPLPPLLARLVVDSLGLECTAEVLTLASMLATDAVLYTPRNLAGMALKAFETARRQIQHPEGDHLTLVNVYQLWENTEDRHALCKDFYLHYNALKRAELIRAQLKDVLIRSLKLKTISSCGSRKEWTRVLQCLVQAQWLHLAKLHSNGKTYITEIGRQEVSLHPCSVLFGTKPLPAYV